MHAFVNSVRKWKFLVYNVILPKKYGRLGRAQTPPPSRSLDILTLKVWMYKIMVWENSDQ